MGLARRTSEPAEEAARSAEPQLSMAPGSTGAIAGGLRRVTTPAWSAIGTPGFMAPEQIRDARTAGHPADVYGLGTTWYALLAGVLPFSGSTPHKVRDLMNYQILQNTFGRQNKTP